MAEVPSTLQLAPGSSAPEFRLPDPKGTLHSPAGLVAGHRGLLLFFACNHCPFVVHLADAIGAFSGEIAAKGLATAAIASNDVGRYPQDGPEHMAGFAEKHHWDFPYLFDASQEVAIAYGAACTPDFFLFDGDLNLAYAGQFDDSRPGRGEPGGADLRRAVEFMLAGEPVPEPWIPSSGCNIKWLPGKEPAWFL